MLIANESVVLMQAKAAGHVGSDYGVDVSPENRNVSQLGTN